MKCCDLIEQYLLDNDIRYHKRISLSFKLFLDEEIILSLHGNWVYYAKYVPSPSAFPYTPEGGLWIYKILGDIRDPNFFNKMEEILEL